jgi:acyl carrier protein
MKERIKNVMSVIFDVSSADILDNANSTSMDSWDSLNHMNLIVALEEEFNVIFSDEEIVELVSLEAIEKNLASKL